MLCDSYIRPSLSTFCSLIFPSFSYIAILSVFSLLLFMYRSNPAFSHCPSPKILTLNWFYICSLYQFSSRPPSSFQLLQIHHLALLPYRNYLIMHVGRKFYTCGATFLILTFLMHFFPFSNAFAIIVSTQLVPASTTLLLQKRFLHHSNSFLA